MMSLCRRLLLFVAVMSAGSQMILSCKRASTSEKSSPNGPPSSAALAEPEESYSQDKDKEAKGKRLDAKAAETQIPKVVSGRVAVRVAPVKGRAEPPTVVISNGMPSAITDARLWVLQTDEGGKILGQKAQWLSKQQAGEREVVLEKDETREFKIAIPAREGARLKFTFSSLSFEDGSRPHIESILVD